jgi:hypothetical protein
MLHHPERHSYIGTKSDGHIQSNRSILDSTGPKANVHYCEKRHGPWSAEKAFHKIFNYNYSEAGYVALSNVIQHLASRTYPNKPVPPGAWYRSLNVNFENLVYIDQPGSKKTVEFRQHHGTMDPEDINMWVIFVTAIVRAAERPVSAAKRSTVPKSMLKEIESRYQLPATRQRAIEAAAKYGDILREPKRSLRQLFDLLQLPVECRRYWWHRVRLLQTIFRADYLGINRSICDAQKPCTKPPIRDNLGWEPGELENQPWDDVLEEDEDVDFSEEDEDVPMDIDSNDSPSTDLDSRERDSTPSPAMFTESSTPATDIHPSPQKSQTDSESDIEMDISDEEPDAFYEIETNDPIHTKASVAGFYDEECCPPSQWGDQIWDRSRAVKAGPQD